jgi:uncharacterized membrane protein (DUF106 family)
MIFKTLDSLFWPAFHITSNAKFNLLFGVFIVSTLISALIIAISYKLVDQKKMKKLKAKVASYQKKINKAKKRKDTKKVAALQRELLKCNKEMMSMSLRPMMYSFIPIILILTWLRRYEYLNDFIAQQGYLVTLPFVLPKFGSTLGWFGWYILCSFPMSILIKKIFKIEGP